jgi:hypothetical protein
MPGVALPGWVRRNHPIVRNETTHWARSRGWRLARSLIWVGSLLFILVPAGCGLLFGLQSQPSGPAAAGLAMGGVFTLGLVLISTLVYWLTNLSASILGATLIARERQNQTWPFLRLTSLSSIEIAGGKLMALLYTLARPVQLVAALRLLTVAAGLVTLALAYAVSGLTIRQLIDRIGPLPDPLTVPASQIWLVLVLGGAGLLVALFNWLAEPFFGALYNGVVGLTVSTLARSPASAIVMVFAAHFGLAFGLYAPVGQFSSLILAALVGSTLQPMAGVELVAVVLLQMGLQALLPWVVLVVCATITLRRIETLND